MKTSRFFEKGRHWLVVLLMVGGLFATVLSYSNFAPGSINPAAAQPSLAGPLIGSGGGPG